MDNSEKLVAAYLAHVGHVDVVYEPDGNQPPDFLVDGRIAVEVRRLNQNKESETGTRGLEEDAFPLSQSVRKVLASMGPPTDAGSWFVTYSFQRPLPPWTEFERKLREALTDLVARGVHHGATLTVSPGFSIRIYRAGEVHSTLFVFGGWIDNDTGGFVIGQIARNLTICVAEKTRKVARVRSKYPEWWLAVVDLIGWGTLDPSEQDQLRAVFEVKDPWDKIIIVSPHDPTRGFAL